MLTLQLSHINELANGDDDVLSTISLDIIHAVNLSGLTTWNRAIVSTENSKFAKEMHIVIM